MNGLIAAVGCRSASPIVVLSLRLIAARETFDNLFFQS